MGGAWVRLGKKQGDLGLGATRAEGETAVLAVLGYLGNCIPAAGPWEVQCPGLGGAGPLPTGMWVSAWELVASSPHCTPAPR